MSGIISRKGYVVKVFFWDIDRRYKVLYIKCNTKDQEGGADVLKLRIKEVAEKQGIKDPVDLASKAGIAYATAYRLWQGNIGTEGRGVGVLVLYKVARALGVKMWELVEETDQGPLFPARLEAVQA